MFLVSFSLSCGIPLFNWKILFLYVLTMQNIQIVSVWLHLVNDCLKLKISKEYVTFICWKCSVLFFQFFLSPNRAVYVLLWNVRLGYEHAGLDFWLSSIKVQAPGAPVFVIGSHIDQVLYTYFMWCVIVQLYWGFSKDTRRYIDYITHYC